MQCGEVFFFSLTIRISLLQKNKTHVFYFDDLLLQIESNLSKPTFVELQENIDDQARMNDQLAQKIQELTQSNQVFFLLFIYVLGIADFFFEKMLFATILVYTFDFSQ